MSTHFLAVKVPPHVTQDITNFVEACDFPGYTPSPASSHITLGLVRLTPSWYKKWSNLVLPKQPTIVIGDYTHFNHKVLVIKVRCDALEAIANELGMRKPNLHITLHKAPPRRPNDYDRAINHPQCPILQKYKFKPVSLDLCELGSAGHGVSGYYNVVDRAYFTEH